MHDRLMLDHALIPGLLQHARPNALDVACVALLLILFQRALAAKGLTARSQAGFLLLGLGQAGLVLTLVDSQSPGLLLPGTFVLGFGLSRLRRGSLEQAYLAVAAAMPALAFAGQLGLTLALLGLPAALLVRSTDRRRALSADLLLVGFPLACTLLALAFACWMAKKGFPAVTWLEEPAVLSGHSAWTKLVTHQLLLPFLFIAALLLLAAPGQLAGPAHALRVLSLAIAGGGALSSLLQAPPGLASILALGAAIALLCALTIIDANARTKAALGLAGALCGSWLLVFLSAPPFGIGSALLASWQGSARDGAGFSRSTTRLDEQGVFPHQDAEYLAQFDRKGAEPVHARQD